MGKIYPKMEYGVDNMNRSNIFERKLPYVIALFLILNSSGDELNASNVVPFSSEDAVGQKKELFSLFSLSPQINGDNVVFYDDNNVDLGGGGDDVLDRMNKKYGYVPEKYRNKLKDFVSSSDVLQDVDASKFVESFIYEKMKIDLEGVPVHIKYLIVWDAICRVIALDAGDKFELYDGDSQFESYFLDALDFWSGCENDFGSGLKKALEVALAQSRKDLEQSRKDLAQSRKDLAQSKEALAQSKKELADSEEEAKQSLLDLMESLKKFYRIYKNNPSSVRPDEINVVVDTYLNQIIPGSEKYGVDYKQELGLDLVGFLESCLKK